jgi:hypothetical protein
MNWAWGGVVVKALRYKSDGPGIDSRSCHWIFFFFFSFRPHHGPGVDSATSENEYQEHFLGVKAAGVCVADLTTFMCRMSWKSVSPNLLELSGPHQACYGRPLPFI